VELTTLLLLLRVASAVILMLIMGTLIIAIWRETRATMAAAHYQRRSFGTLQVLARIDSQYAATGVTHALLPFTTIGRSPTNAIVIPQSFASAEHATITLRNGQWWLEDRHSTNGTLLNEQLVTAPTIVTDGDVIGIGHTYFRLLLE